MKKIALATGMAIIAIGVGVTVALAAGYIHPFWGDVQATSSVNTAILIEATTPSTIDGQGNYTSNINNEAFFYLDESLAGFASDKYGDPRAEILMKRTGSLGTGEAWIKSSAGAKIHVQTDGDVEITIGD